MVLLADAKPVIVLAGQDQGFKLTPDQLDAAITDRTKLFVLNSPSNPTGAAYTFDELKALGEVLLRYPRVIIATDDMYEHIMFEGHSFATLLNTCPDLYERTVVMNGVSKAYSMTGWRIGYCGGPTDLIKAMKKVQSQSTSNPTSISQYAAQAALEGDQDCVKEMCKAFEQRHHYVYNALNDIEGFECLPSAGTFYSFPNVEKALASLHGINDDVQIAEHLLDKVGVALVPGSAFGAPGHIRISFATSMENLEQAISRIKSAVNP